MEKLGRISFRQSNGQETSLSNFTGKVLLIVNVASKCGFTPQYEALEKIYEKYKDNGFSVIAFPANEFGAQEPGTNEEIQEFCRGTFGVQFPVMEKIVVKGEGQHPLYKTLTSTKPNAKKKASSTLEKTLREHNLWTGGPGDISWNFEKFLISRNGKVIERFAPDMAPDDQEVLRAIEMELSL